MVMPNLVLFWKGGYYYCIWFVGGVRHIALKQRPCICPYVSFHWLSLEVQMEVGDTGVLIHFL